MSLPLPYSYHTFLFPFIWNSSINATKESFFSKCNKNWAEICWEEEAPPKNTSMDVWMQNYAAAQYFTDSANKAIFGIGGDLQNPIVHCYEYRLHGKPIHGRGIYLIEKLIEKKIEKKIKKENQKLPLTIHNIRLQVYEMGIAILILELENDKNRSLDFVNQINEYGRRVQFPFLPIEGSHPLCADRISIQFGENLFEEENFLETLQSIQKSKTPPENFSLHYMMSPIKKLLGDQFTSNPQQAKKDNNLYYLKPCIDDRMFVCCLIRDDTFSKRLTEYVPKQKTYRYLADCETKECSLSNVLYQFGLIETSLTCQSVVMKKQLLEKYVYDRWIDYGTLYVSTPHALVCATSSDENLQAPVINPFLTQYIQMATLVLAQRAAILALSDHASDVVKSFGPDLDTESNDIKEIENLQENYVKIQNQFLLCEVTVQEQGVELYQMLQKNLYIQNNKNELDDQMDNLREMATIIDAKLERQSDKTMNNILFILAAIGLPLTIIQTASAWFSDDLLWLFGATKQMCVLVVAAVALVCIILYITLFSKRQSRRKSKKRCKK